LGNHDTLYSESKLEAQLYAHGVSSSHRHLEKGTFTAREPKKVGPKNPGLEKCRTMIVLLVWWSFHECGMIVLPRKLKTFELRTDFKMSHEPLETEKILTLDPSQSNPICKGGIVKAGV